MNLRLLGNRLLLEPLPKPAKSAGGIDLLEAYNDDRMQWLVVAAGPGLKLKDGAILPPEIAAGDKVLTPLYFDHTTLDGGRKIVDAAQVIAILGIDEGNTAPA